MSNERPTPYDIVFGGPGFDESFFDLIREQVEARPASSPTELFMLPAAGTLLKELIPEGDGEGSHQELVAQVSGLLFHAFRFWLHGRQTWEFPEAATRELLTGTGPGGDWSHRPPALAGYVQLPRNLLWARVSEEAAPEPADGFFWSAPTPEEGATVPRLDLLLALGVRKGRPGFSVVDAALEPGDTLHHWADVEARPGGTDFANVLPGGELQGYHALTTRAELLKLVARCFRRLDSPAASAADPGGGQGEGEGVGEGAEGPRRRADG
jgi:hypothetical protein